MKPMLAKNFDPDYVSDHAFLQPKLDGHRAVWTGKKLLSRTGKEIVSVPGIIDELEKKFKNIPLDGELYCHDMRFDEICSIVARKKNVQDDDRIIYAVFDAPKPKLKFAERWEELKQKFKGHSGKSRIELVVTLSVDRETALGNLNIFADQGYEGTMLRNADGCYKHGRSADLLKIKKFHDAEAVVIGVQQYIEHEKLIVPKGTPGARQKSNGTWSKNGKGTPRQMAGALICITLDTKKQFEIGTGLDDKMRKEFWKNKPLAKIVTFKYQEYTKDGVPRFPVFLRFRQDI